MPEILSESHKHRLHEEWLSRGAYDECFGSREPPLAFKNWRGNPDPCRCGCDEVRYSRSNPHNLWKSLSPQLLWETGFLFPIFRAFRNFLWALLGLAWANFRTEFRASAFKAKVISGHRGRRGGWGMMPLRFLNWAAISLFMFLIVVAAWIVSRFALFVLAPLYVLGMAIILAVLLFNSTFAAISLASIGLVFLIGAAASFAFDASPVLGIALIVAGVCFEYEGRRQRDRQNREQLGRILRKLSDNRTASPPVGAYVEDEQQSALGSGICR